jgi:hypothetical protein
LELACRVIIGLVFAASAAGKLRPATFTAFVVSVRALAPWAAGRAATPLAGITLGAELAVAVAVLPHRTAPVALGVAALLLLAFTAALASAVRRGVDTPCRCFGASSSRPPGPPQVIRNLFLIVVAVAGIAASSGAAVQPGGAVVAVAAGLTAALLAIAADDLAFLLPSPRTRS